MTHPSTLPSANKDWNRPNTETLEALAEMDDMIRHGTGKEFRSVSEVRVNCVAIGKPKPYKNFASHHKAVIRLYGGLLALAVF